MKKFISVMVAIFAVFFFLELAESAEKSLGSKPLEDVSAQDIVEIGKKNNLDCEIKILKNRKPMVVVRSMTFLDIPILIHFYDRKANGRYGSISFVTYIDTGSKKYTHADLLKKVNEHNRKKRFIRMSVDDENDVCIDSDLYLEGGIMPAAIEDTLFHFGKRIVFISIELLK